jgi:hypothetical protein
LKIRKLLLAAGFWLLAAGCWFLAAGYWLVLLNDYYRNPVMSPLRKVKRK